MVKWISRIIGIAVLAAALWWGWQTFFPSDERRILRLLNTISENASMPAGAKFVSEVLAADRLKGCFTPQIELDVDVPGHGRHTFSGREELIQAYMLARSDQRGLEVRFMDVLVTVGQDHQSATAELTARIRKAGEGDFDIQELRLQFHRVEDAWRVSHVETTRSIKQP